MCRRWLWPAFALVALAVGCAEPPNKEMDQAQGAIDAARAAGAEQYATAEYTAATDALKRAQDAVAASDYRLALNHAIDSRERAQNAARQAADSKAQVRGEVERTMAEVTALTTQAYARLEAAQKARVPRRVLAEPAKTLAAINRAVQEAGEKMRAGDYLAARPVLLENKERLQKTLATLNAAVTPPAQRRRR
jgi:hypothetical protein